MKEPTAVGKQSLLQPPPCLMDAIGPLFDKSKRVIETHDNYRFYYVFCNHCMHD